MNRILPLLLLAAVLAAEDAPLSLDEALVRTLERNGDLVVRRLARDAGATAEAEARAAFDPTVSAEASRSESSVGGGPTTTTDTLSAGLSGRLPTGTEVAVEGEAARSDPAAGARWTTRTGLSVTQALLQGRSLGANLAAICRARIDLRISDAELRGFATALVAECEAAYWDLVLARRRVAIVEQAVEVARRQAADTAERIRLGRTAAAEQVAADAELAARRQDRIDAAAALEQARLVLGRLFAGDWTAAYEPTTGVGDGAEAPLALDEHLRLAETLRSDLVQARLERERGELAVVETRQGLLPRLDLFATLGRTGYSDSLAGSVPFTGGEDGADARIGLRFAQVIGRRAEAASAQRAEIDARRLDEALANQRRLVEYDVRSAYLETTRAAAAVDARRATARLRAESLRTVQAQAAVGRATALQVAQAERDLLEAEIGAAEAEVAARTAITALFRQDGSLLQRRGIAAP